MSSQARVSDFFPTVRSSTRKASGKRSTPSISKVKTAKVESMRETEELASPAKRRTSTTGSESKKVESSEPKPSSSKPVVQPPPNTFRRKLFAESGKQTTEDEAKPSTGEKVPAYKRLAYLTKKSTADESGELDLPLPYKYRKMLEVFKKIDYFAWVYLKRHETCTFEKLKQSIEQSTHRLFDQDSLLSILSVPGPKWFQLDRQVCKGKSQLTITPVYCDSNKCVNSATNLTEREKEYVRCLLELTRREHLKFLAEMKIQLPAGKSIFRWHPMFRLDSVPDIAPNRALLPKQEVTTDPNSILNYCIRKSKAQNEVVQPEPKPGEESSPVKRDKVKRGLLKGISVELLNKVSLGLLLSQTKFQLTDSSQGGVHSGQANVAFSGD